MKDDIKETIKCWLSTYQTVLERHKSLRTNEEKFNQEVRGLINLFDGDVYKWIKSCSDEKLAEQRKWFISHLENIIKAYQEPSNVKTWRALIDDLIDECQSDKIEKK